MTKDLIERSRRRRQPGDVPLILTTVALMLSLAVAITPRVSAVLRPSRSIVVSDFPPMLPGVAPPRADVREISA